jgi:transposase
MAKVKRYGSLSYEQRAKKRVEAQRLLAAGVPGATVARLIGTNKATVFFWKEAVQVNGSQALEGLLKPGRKNVFTEAQVTQLIRLLKKKPSRYGIEHRHDMWTWDGIVELTQQELGIECVRQTLQRALSRAGWEMP